MVIAPITSKAVMALANIPNYKMPISLGQGMAGA